MFYRLCSLSVLFFVTWQIFGYWVYMFIRMFWLLRVKGWFDHARLYRSFGYNKLYFKFVHNGLTYFAVSKTKSADLPLLCEERELLVYPTLLRRGYYKVTTIDSCERRLFVYSLFSLIWCVFAVYLIDRI